MVDRSNGLPAAAAVGFYVNSGSRHSPRVERDSVDHQQRGTRIALHVAEPPFRADLLADDATWTIVGNSPASRTYNSRREFLDLVIGPFNARMASPLVPVVRASYAEGDWVIALFDAAGTARDGRPYRNTYSWYLRLRGGQIVEAIAFDTIEFTDFGERITPVAERGISGPTE